MAIDRFPVLNDIRPALAQGLSLLGGKLVLETGNVRSQGVINGTLTAVEGGFRLQFRDPLLSAHYLLLSGEIPYVFIRKTGVEIPIAGIFPDQHKPLAPEVWALLAKFTLPMVTTIGHLGAFQLPDSLDFSVRPLGSTVRLEFTGKHPVGVLNMVDPIKIVMQAIVISETRLKIETNLGTFPFQVDS